MQKESGGVKEMRKRGGREKQADILIRKNTKLWNSKVWISHENFYHSNNRLKIYFLKKRGSGWCPVKFCRKEQVSLCSLLGKVEVSPTGGGPLLPSKLSSLPALLCVTARPDLATEWFYRGRWRLHPSSASYVTETSAAMHLLWPQLLLITTPGSYRSILKDLHKCLFAAITDYFEITLK